MLFKKIIWWLVLIAFKIINEKYIILINDKIAPKDENWFQNKNMSG